ncbi:4'-phosphopantetheinyl transferase superfamily protein [soil metagenome]
MTADSLWRNGPCDFNLADNQVHVWQASLDWPPSRLPALHQILSEDERAKADRFYFAHDRLHYMVARGLLRTLLGHYLQMPPEQLHFVYNPYGKPMLSSPADQAPLSFNVSHSGGFVLYAFARKRTVGIDIERMRPDLDYAEMVEHVFSPYERREFHTLAASQKPDGFFNAWTRKEAYIKARGLGLALPLDQFDVTMHPDEPARLLKTAHEPLAAQQWSLCELKVAPGYKAALVVEGHAWQLTCWQWPD